ncbi:hypothetical protein niasHT_002900 [Heterodera trifolii]|uniref:Uncharacterized protein n=1 Tax=Heterodera trifolii TaxID=157864 RepID=A0ABD2LNX4_9BILA
MSDNRNEAEEEMEKAIFISGNGWLCVFDLLPPSQIGLGIALISHRFNIYVDEHFKTRKWTLAFIRIRRKIGENGTNQMEIVNSHGKPLPTAQIQMPPEVIGLRFARISFIDQNAVAFLHSFCPLFAACQIYLTLCTSDDRTLELIIHNIWPMLGRNIHGMEVVANGFRRLRQFVPSFSAIVHRFDLSSLAMSAISSPNSRPMTVPMLPMDKRWPNGFSLRFKTVCQKCSYAGWATMKGLFRR